MKRFFAGILSVIMTASCIPLSVVANPLNQTVNSSVVDFDYAATRDAINNGTVKVYNDKPSVTALKGIPALATTTHRINDARGTTATETGQYPSRRGMYLVTNASVHTGDIHAGITGIAGHAGMVYGTEWTIESFPNGGVQEKTDNWSELYSDVIAATTNDTTITEDAYIAFYCYEHLGYPYNWDFMDYETEDAFYCSQLIYKAFKEVQGINLKAGSAEAITPGSLVRTQLIQNDVITIVYTYED